MFFSWMGNNKLYIIYYILQLIKEMEKESAFVTSLPCYFTLVYLRHLQDVLYWYSSPGKLEWECVVRLVSILQGYYSLAQPQKSGTGAQWSQRACVLTWRGSQRVSSRKRVRRQVVARDRLFGTTSVRLLLQLEQQRFITGRLAAPIVWLTLPERWVVVGDAEAKSSGQTLLRTKTKVACQSICRSSSKIKIIFNHKLYYFFRKMVANNKA